MKSQGVQNPSTDQKNKGDIQKIFSDILKNFNLKLNEVLTLREIVARIQKNDFTIASIMGTPIPDINFEATISLYKDQNNFKKRFFDNLLFETESDKVYFEEIINNFDTEFLIGRVSIIRLNGREYITLISENSFQLLTIIC